MNGNTVAISGFRKPLVSCITATLLLALSPRTSVATLHWDGRDVCEREAVRAYAAALKLCQLAGTENPRLKCYEAAKAAYVRKLEECRTCAR
jgi:hypothetical protein